MRKLGVHVCVGVIDIFLISIVVMGSQVHTYGKANQIVHYTMHSLLYVN